MDMMNSEGFFKFVFGSAIFIFCLVIVGLFLVLLKVLLIFTPSISLMGLLITQ